MKNDENDEYSKIIEVADKKNQISKYLTRYYADNHVIKKSDYYNNEHENKQKHVVHIISIMFNRADDDNYFTDVIKK